MKHLHEETVAEIQGYYGSLNIAERLLQEIWSQQDFETRCLTTVDKRPLKILNPGVWNHQEGPDFKSATIQVEDQIMQGDVEIHLYPKDWKLHGHSRDPEYSRVLLHVTLFEGQSPSGSGDPKHHLVLLPHLEGDLEELMTHYAWARHEVEDPLSIPWAKELVQVGQSTGEQEQHKLLYAKAESRWNLKLQFARNRILEHGWRQACHQMMMEVLGYRRNRTVMHRIAVQYPLAKNTQPDWQADEVFREYRSEWKLAGIRPSNQPLKRLMCYHQLVQRHPDWPEILVQSLHCLQSEKEGVLLQENPGHILDFRRSSGMHRWIADSKSKLFSDVVGGSRLNTLFCDAFLPLLSVASSRELFPVWFSWPLGDAPDSIKHVIRALSVSRVKGAAHCNGWVQGCLQLALEEA